MWTTLKIKWALLSKAIKFFILFLLLTIVGGTVLTIVLVNNVKAPEKPLTPEEKISYFEANNETFIQTNYSLEETTLSFSIKNNEGEKYPSLKGSYVIFKDDTKLEIENTDFSLIPSNNYFFSSSYQIDDDTSKYQIRFIINYVEEITLYSTLRTYESQKFFIKEPVVEKAKAPALLGDYMNKLGDEAYATTYSCYQLEDQKWLLLVLQCNRIPTLTAQYYVGSNVEWTAVYNITQTDVTNENAFPSVDDSEGQPTPYIWKGLSGRLTKDSKKYTLKNGAKFENGKFILGATTSEFDLEFNISSRDTINNFINAIKKAYYISLQNKDIYEAKN